MSRYADPLVPITFARLFFSSPPWGLVPISRLNVLSRSPVFGRPCQLTSEYLERPGDALAKTPYKFETVSVHHLAFPSAVHVIGCQSMGRYPGYVNRNVWNKRANGCLYARFFTQQSAKVVTHL